MSSFSFGQGNRERNRTLHPPEYRVSLVFDTGNRVSHSHQSSITSVRDVDNFMEAYYLRLALNGSDDFVEAVYLCLALE